MRKSTIEEFIEKAKLIHGVKYDYSKVKYIGTNSKVVIICPNHGDFEQTPHNHLADQGCAACGSIKTGSKIKSNTKDFIIKALEIHRDKYDYSKVNYTHSQEKVIIICPTHGEFTQQPTEHLRGRGYNKCGSLVAAESTKKSNEIFIQECINTHGYKYDYSKSIYVNAVTKVLIICPEHGEFYQRPSSHTEGQSCPACVKYGFDQTKPAYLYYLKITTDDNQILYKIGITNRTVNERFNLTDLSKIEIVKQKLYENGADALAWETKLKRKYKEFQYKGQDILSSGNTELFTEDIMALHYNS